VVGVFLAILASEVAAPVLAATGELQSLMPGWERFFSVTWSASQNRGRSVVDGYIRNRSPYTVSNIRLLVDSLDQNGQITDQRLSWVSGSLGADGRLYYEVPVSPAASYRVSVFSYDRIEAASLTTP
jgi:hypothetical protein